VLLILYLNVLFVVINDILQGTRYKRVPAEKLVIVLVA